MSDHHTYKKVELVGSSKLKVQIYCTFSNP